MNELLEKAKTDRKLLKKIKLFAVDAQLYELACSVREIEREFFPENDEVKKAKEQGSHMNLLFRMIDLNIPDKESWLITETLKYHQKMKGKFSISDAVDLKLKAKELFD